ncbi:MAG TPA: glycosyl hydrolase family 18 protein [bacterium]|nr:glycosyl hydrolase family 18 protein [bacterium]
MSKLRFSAWMSGSGPAALASLQAHAHQLNRLYPSWYSLGPYAQVQRSAHAGAALRAQVGAFAQAHGVELWPLLSAGDPAHPAPQAGLLRLLLHERGARQAHLAQLLHFLKADHAVGVDLSYPGFYSADQAAFGDFVAEVAAALHQEKLKVGLIVRARVDPRRDALPDYKALAAACDRIQVLGCGFHGPDSGPGPIAPPHWQERVLSQALDAVPLEKMEWGLPAFGWRWTPREQPKLVAWSDWEPLVKSFAPERRDPETAEMHLSFSGSEVWMNDAISLTAKLWPCRRAGVGDVALWSLGQEDPRVWALVETLPEPFVESQQGQEFH